MLIKITNKSLWRIVRSNFKNFLFSFLFLSAPFFTLSLVTHTISFLAKRLTTKSTCKRLRVFVNSEMILQMTHLLKHFFAFFVTTYEELHTSLRFTIQSLYVKVAIKGVYRFYLVVTKQTHNSLKYCWRYS